MDRGIVVPLREYVLDAEVRTGAALRYIVDNAERVAEFGPVPVVELGAGSLDCHGAPALLVAPTVLDAARCQGAVEVRNVHAAESLVGLVVSGPRQGVQVTVDARDDVACVTAATAGPTSVDLAGGAARLAAAADGIDLEAELWWTAYRRSNLALSVDTRLSRRHAGATIVEEDGSVRGATDDEIDPTVYSGQRAALFDESQEQA
jgi:hypothetical protein